MARLLPSLFALILAAPVLAQAPQKTPQQSLTATLRAGTKLVIVDVVVTDRSQHPVHNLKPGDFTLLENNIPQTFKNFEEHTSLAGAAAGTSATTPLPATPAGVFTNYTAIPTNGPLNVLLLDRLNTPMQDQASVMQQIVEYLKQAKSGTRIAIFGLTTQLTMLQGFTDDPGLLKAVVSNKANLKASPLLDDPTGSGNVPDKMSDVLKANSSVDAETVLNMQQFEAQMTSDQLQNRAKFTLDAMNALARYLVGFPGRKNLLWFSGSFPVNILPNDDLSVIASQDGTLQRSASPQSFSVVASSEVEFRETTNLLAQSQVAVYPIDARGLIDSPIFSPANSDGSKYASVRNQRAPGSLSKDLNASQQQNIDEHSTMDEMARETGGRAFVNTNGLTDAIHTAIESGSNYYTIAYTPTDNKLNGDYRKIEVKLQQRALNLSYRRGYYADDPAALPKPHAAPLTANAGSAIPVTGPIDINAMRIALMRGGPKVTQIILTVGVLPVGTALEDTIAPNNVASINLTGHYRRYTIKISADPRGLSFTTAPDGTHQDGVQFITYVYDQDGAIVDAVAGAARAHIQGDISAAAAHGGISFHQEISVPAKGDYFLRIAVHDLQGDRVGAVEIPISAIRNLPPAAPPTPAPK